MTMNYKRLKYICLLTSNSMPHGNYDIVHASGKDAKWKLVLSWFVDIDDDQKK
jgi:hypothetical protein